MRSMILAAGLLLAHAPLAAERITQGNLVMEGIPPVAAETFDRLRQYNEVRSASLRDWTPEGELLIGTRFANTVQLHRVQQPLGTRRQLTFYDEPVAGGDFPDDGPWQHGFLFLKDVGGNEQNQIFFFDTRTGRETLLTDGESRNTAPAWFPNGERFVFASNRRDGRNMDIWIGGPDGPDSARLLHEVDGSWMPLDVSPDNRHVLLLHYVSINEAYLHELDIESGQTRELRPLDEPVGYGGAVYSHDGKAIYFISDENSEFRRLRRLDRNSGKVEVLTEELEWDVNGVDVASDGRWLAYTVNEGGVSKLYLLDVRRNRSRALDMPVGVMSGPRFSPDNRSIAVTVSAADSSGDVYVHDIDRKRTTRWTESEVGGLDTEQFVTPSLVEFPSFDNRMIPAFVYRPQQAEGKAPVIINIHGGPESQYRPGFSATIQYFVNELGTAVIAPNVRGSAGYGKTYLQLDNGFRREDSVKDIGALLDWIATQPDLDEERVIVMGGSYGGYMVLASMVHFDERLLGGVDIVGISNFVTFLKNTQDYRRDLRRAEYGDERDPEMHEFLQRISPNNRADEISNPLLVVQGANDPRVPLSESEQMVETIREAGGEVWYLMAKDEGHGFRKQENREVYMAVVVTFLEELLSR